MGSKKKFNVIDLFCGCGGLSLGFKMANFNIVGGVDFDKDCIDTFSLYFKNSTNFYGDIAKISDKEINELGFFDTYPINNSTSFNGVWSVYPYFESGIISISDSNSGLFLVKKSQ